MRPIVNHLTDQVDQWLSRSKIAISPDLTPLVKNRMAMGASAQDSAILPGEWFLKTLRGALIYLPKTWSERDGQKEHPLFTLVRNDNALSGRTGSGVLKIAIGE